MSCSARMLGWLSAATACASRSKRGRRSGMSPASAGSTLTATSRAEPGIPRAVDLAHAPAADRPEDLVRPQPRADAYPAAVIRHPRSISWLRSARCARSSRSFTAFGVIRSRASQSGRRDGHRSGASSRPSGSRSAAGRPRREAAKWSLCAGASVPATVRRSRTAARRFRDSPAASRSRSVSSDSSRRRRRARRRVSAALMTMRPSHVESWLSPRKRCRFLAAESIAS